MLCFILISIRIGSQIPLILLNDDLLIKQHLVGQRKKKHTVQKMKFSISGFFSKCDQIRSFLRIWSNLLKIYVMENSCEEV